MTMRTRTMQVFFVLPMLMVSTVGSAFAQDTPCKPGWKTAANGGCEQVWDTHPEILSKVEGQYTEEARAARIEGTVVLQLDVGVDGLPHNIRVVQSLDPGLDQKAIEALNQWRFQPATKDGHPVVSQAKVNMDFRLSHKAQPSPITAQAGPAVVKSSTPQSCPVLITNLSTGSVKAALFAGMTGAGSSRSYLTLKYQNNSDKQVSGIRFTVVYLNSLREPYHTEDLTTPTGSKLKPGKGFSLLQPDGDVTGGEKMEVLGWVAKALFSDGTSWSDDGSKSCTSSNSLKR